MADFPAIKPSSRQYTLGQFPVKTYRGLSGATVKRVFGNRAYGHSIELEFNNVSDTTAKALIDHYYGQNGSVDRFALSEEALAGMNDALKSVVKVPANIAWEYAEPPSVESVFNGRSNVTVRLIGELNS